MRRCIAIRKNKGMYTVEGAFTIIIFTALFMAILSVISIVKTEVEVQCAIDDVAKMLSQYSYVVTGNISSTNEETTSIRSILVSTKREVVAHTIGAAICEKTVKGKLDEKVLLQIDGGFEGIDFLSSDILGDGKTIKIVAIYNIKINAFGFLDRTLKIRQEARTLAWLPVDVDEILVNDDTSDSIWNDTNFARGKYFVQKIKSENVAVAVASGVGIDLYFKDTKTAVEITSMNLFSSSYCFCDGDATDINSYAPNTETISERIDEIIADFEEDIEKIDKTIKMESGAVEKFEVQEKVLYLIVPKEVEGSEAFEMFLNEETERVNSGNGVTIEIIYDEEAL